jgi:response regulator NasT
MVVDDHERSRAAARAAVRAAGGEVAAEATRCADVAAAVERARPDVAIFAVGLADGDGIAAAAAVTAAHGVPVVLSTSRAGDGLVARARAAGVMAWLTKPLRGDDLAPTLDLAVARFQESRKLQQRLGERKVIERAKGRLMDRHRLTEDEAFGRMRRAAMDSRRPMVEIARAVLAADAVAAGRPLSAAPEAAGS